MGDACLCGGAGAGSLAAAAAGLSMDRGAAASVQPDVRASTGGSFFGRGRAKRSKEVTNMTYATMFLIGTGVSLTIASLVVVYLRRPLELVLTDLCGTAERARFWTASRS